MKVLTDENFEQETAEGIVLVDFAATWCGPCRATAPIFEELSQEVSEGQKVVKVDVDDSPETAIKFGIRSIPTIVVLNNGEEFSRTIGANPNKDFYKKLIDEVK